MAGGIRAPTAAESSTRTPAIAGRRDFPEEFVAVADHEQEDEPVQVGAEGFDAVGRVADEGGVPIGEGLFVAAGRLARKNSAVR